MGQIDRSKKDNFQKNTMGAITPTTPSIYGKYFSIDVSNLSKYMKNAVDNGKDYKEVIVATNNDLDIFIEAHIRKYNNGRFNVEFWGDRVELTAKLVGFINDCYKRLGPCLTGEGEVTKEDYERVEQRNFSRMWEDVCVTMSNNDKNVLVMVLGVYNPPQNMSEKPSSLKPSKVKKA